ncbi:MAG TPA: SIMPL domain-containing protein [Dehalococcoidia bacterium]|jgi:uncharacterized protein YggE|nr:SIMPL domain-containing protein [Dehalococcoidia bacterium]
MNTIKARNKRILTLLGMGLALVFLVACASQTPSPTGNAGTPNGQSSPTAAPASGTESSGNSSTSTDRSGLNTAATVVSHHGQINGVSVSGQGRTSGAPDLATINLGVEGSRDTVQAARNDAAAAMEQVIGVLREQGVQKRDIQTSYFSIHPRYDPEGQSVIGFQVSNQLTVKVRDLGRVGAIIDEVTAAGGNLTRFQGIHFSIEDTKPLEEQARAAAVQDMTAKANQLAGLMGVELGSPVSIMESGAVQPLIVPAAERAFFDQAAAPTPIMSGEVDVTVTLQAVYAIQ